MGCSGSQVADLVGTQAVTGTRSNLGQGWVDRLLRMEVVQHEQSSTMIMRPFGEQQCQLQENKQQCHDPPSLHSALEPMTVEITFSLTRRIRHEATFFSI